MSYCVVYRGAPVRNGNFVTPAGAMARGLGVARSTTTIAKAGVGVIPIGFLNNKVTTDGPTYEEKMHISATVHAEKKVSVGQVQVIYYEPGIEYVMYGVNKAGTTFAVGEYVVQGSDGLFTDDAGAWSGNKRLGRVQEIDVLYGTTSEAVVWKAEADLGNVT